MAGSTIIIARNAIVTTYHYDRRSYNSHSYDRRSSYRIHYNGAAVSGGHISIDLSRH